MEPDLFAEVEAQAKRLGLPPGFYTQLLSEDDWSFVIKLNALIEAACSDALAAAFHNPSLASALASLDLGHRKHGKVALLRALNSIAKEHAATLQLVYELRNSLAHNVGQLSFSFSPYVQGLDKNQLASFVERAGHGIAGGPNGQSARDFVISNPKLAIWLTVAEILACLHLEHVVAENRLLKLAIEAFEAPKS